MASRIRERWSDDKVGRLGALIHGGLQMEFGISRLSRELEFVNSRIRSSRICEFRVWSGPGGMGGRFCRCDDEEGGRDESSEEKARSRKGNSGEAMECG